VLDRELMFNTPNSVQAAMLHRLAKILAAAQARLEGNKDRESPGYKEAVNDGLEAMAKVLDVFASLVADDVQEWLVQQMLTGKIDDKTLSDMLTQMTPDEEPTTPKAPVKRARRA
jgi:hypothetical protein